jgi:hypothetical protein
MDQRAAAAAVTGSAINALTDAGHTLDTLAQATGTPSADLRERLDTTSELTWAELVIAGGLTRTHPSVFLKAAA